MITAPEIDLISLAPVLVLSVFTMLVMLIQQAGEYPRR
jgi:hypothetical protein